MKIELSGNYSQMYEKLRRRDPHIVDTVIKKILLFRKNPKDTRLKVHPLKKRMRGKYAFSVTDDIRIVFMWLGKTSVRFLAIGNHQEVYKKE